MKIDIIDENAKVIEQKELKDAVENRDNNEIISIYNRFVRNAFRKGNASTKTRAEVAISGTKAYKQKGTGNARRGANSTPLRRGGGVIFGPKPRSYKFKLNKKLIASARLATITSKDNAIQVLKKNINITKTKEAKKIIENKKKVLLLISGEEINITKGFRNLKNIIIDHVAYFEPEIMLTSDLVLLSHDAFKEWEKNYD